MLVPVGGLRGTEDNRRQAGRDNFSPRLGDFVVKCRADQITSNPET
jgi:hypothetical protein